MIQKFDRTDRRILKFPAVHPSKDISPTTLLASLTNLSQNILKFQSNLFMTQKRNARETIRQVRNLQIFLEEIQDWKSISSDSAILCFSELHVTFQKLLFLFEDCTRDGARLWILMKSQFVASQFRVLVRAIATALEVLPSIEVTVEVKELVELTGKHARDSNLGADPDDEITARLVQSILNGFEDGFEPEFSIAKRVLDYLQIRSWSDCNREIKFLTEFLEFYGDDRESSFLSSLIAFMCYCRGVIFETLDHRNIIHQSDDDTKFNAKLLSCLNPEDFRCPISLELMFDPVTVSTGQTYDRSSIEKWLNSGNNNCPKTGEQLTNSELIPNNSLRSVIRRFCSENGISLSKSGSHSRDISKTIVPGSSAAGKAMNFLANFLRKKLVLGNEEGKNKAAYEIRLLTKSSIFNRSCLIEAGTIPSLLNLLSSSDSSAQENAIGALLKLSKHSKGKKKIIKNRGLDSILEVLKHGMNLESKQIAAATIFYLSTVEEYRKFIGETPEAIPALVELIREGSYCGKKNAVVAIFGLLLYGGNHRRVVESGIIPLLVDLLTNFSIKADLITEILAVLAALAERREGKEEGSIRIVRTSSSLSLILGILNSSSSSGRGKEYCVSILVSSCINGGDEVIGKLARDASLPVSLYSMVTEGTPYGSKKALSLLRILHKYCETSCSYGFS